jgi:myo-inositol-1(or 4)-monophosphatase
LQERLALAESAARRAGAVLRAAYDQPVSITNKGAVDLVTQADRDAEDLIIEALHDAVPDDTILAEEGGETQSGRNGLTWIVDPLDGTTNFAHGFPVFAVSIGLRTAEEVLLGVIYDPLRDECFTAAKDQGAALNNQPIHVSRVSALSNALLATGFPYDRHEAEDNNSLAFAVFLRRAQGIRRAGAAALDIAYVACGRVDAYWELRWQQWDVGAGVVIVREAGGTVSDYEGVPGDDHVLAGRRLIASNGLIHEEVVRILGEVYEQHSH